MKQLILINSISMQNTITDTMTLFEAIERQDEPSILSLLDQIIELAHEGALEADDIYAMLEDQDLYIGPSIKEIIETRLKKLEKDML